MTNSADHLATIRRYLKAIEEGTFADIEPLFTPDVIMEQLPNRIYPNGLRGNRAQMGEGFAKGRKLLSSQSYEIKNSIANADSVAIEVLWTGTLAVPLGTLAADSKMRCHSGMFFAFRDGRIAHQRNYDCFEPW